MITKNQILEQLKNKKSFLQKEYGISKLGIYGSYARDEAKKNSDIDIFYERDASVKVSGFDLLRIPDMIENDLHIKVDFVDLKYMNPIVKHYAQKDFIYV